MSEKMEKGAVIKTPGSTEVTKTGAWRAVAPNVDKEKCIGCGQCETFCPDDAIHVNADKKAEVDFDFCKGCGICANQCPVKAITMKEENK